MEKMKCYGILALLLSGVVFSTAATAYKGDYSVEGPDCDEERHDAMEKAFESLDHNAWYALMTKDGRHPRVVDRVTEENFHLFVQAHVAGKSGDEESAQKIRADIGLNNGKSPRDGEGQGKGMNEGKGSGNGKESGKQMGQGKGKGNAMRL